MSLFGELAEKTGQSAIRLFKRDRKGLHETQAEITYTDQSSGRVMSGQIIKAALELYFGKTVAADYMDHVYSVEIIALGVLPYEFTPYRRITVAGKTLAAAGVHDEFTAHNPGRIVLEIDDTLSFEE